MGKKKPEEMAKERAEVRGHCTERGIEAKVATPIFDLMEKFAGVRLQQVAPAAYALVAYQTAWLKVHYPAEFMAAVLSSDMDNTDKVVGFLDEARALGLTVLPPDVNASAYMFEATDPKTIRYGPGRGEGRGRGACEAIAAAAGIFRPLRRPARFRQARGCRQAQPAHARGPLIHGGAMDALAKNRASLMLQLPELLKATDQITRNRDAGMVDMFGNATGAPDIHIELPECADWPLAQLLQGERAKPWALLQRASADPAPRGIEAAGRPRLRHRWTRGRARLQEARRAGASRCRRWSQARWSACASAAISCRPSCSGWRTGAVASNAPLRRRVVEYRAAADPRPHPRW